MINYPRLFEAGVLIWLTLAFVSIILRVIYQVN